MLFQQATKDNLFLILYITSACDKIVIFAEDNVDGKHKMFLIVFDCTYKGCHKLKQCLN